MSAFDADRDAVIARAREAGVGRIMNPGVDLDSSRRAVALAEKYPEVYAAVGFHPHDAAKLGADELRELRVLATHPKVKAIGEIGLDYYRNLSPQDVQQKAFRAQLELAAELSLPVIIHNREAFADVIGMLTEWGWAREAARPSGVLHSFSGDRTQVEPSLKVNFLLGLTGPITFPKADEMRAVAATAPLSKLLVETDAPYLTPAPRRGKRNEPAYARYVAGKLAEVRGEDFETIVRQTGANASLLFEWSNSD
ncbi:MAG: TatD family hydrolase [Chloroflexi bacterium]|nr:TatD family hydrolase [Chloroflexota bacterium]